MSHERVTSEPVLVFVREPRFPTCFRCLQCLCELRFGCTEIRASTFCEEACCSMSEKENEPGLPSQSSGQLDKEEAWLWRLALLFLVFLATALAAESCERLQSLPYHLGLLPIAVLCIAILFAGF